jgi:hypothetical protein
MATDDFAYLAQVAAAFFFTLGRQNLGTTTGINHATNFMADDSSIPIGIQAICRPVVGNRAARRCDAGKKSWRLAAALARAAAAQGRDSQRADPES